MDQSEPLRLYRFAIEDLYRQQEHVLDEAGERLTRQWTRGGDELACLLFDLDHFKRVNDRHGHAAGDDVLVALSACIKETLRKGDFAARIGGDEFVVIIDPFDADAVAEELAGRIRACVSQPIALPEGQTYRASVSVGVATFPDSGNNATALLTAADAAMYADKLANRSR